MPSEWPSVTYCFLSTSCQYIFLKAHGSASIYFSSQGWYTHVFEEGLRLSTISSSLLYAVYVLKKVFQPLFCSLFFPAGSECGTATIYLSLQSREVYAFRAASTGFTSLRHVVFFRSCECGKASTYLSLPELVPIKIFETIMK